MYANKLAVAVKHRGKALQEFGEVVYLPFGSEYGLLIKNLNTVRASVKVSIDGQDAAEGVTLVVPPNSSIELERFIKNGNLNKGNRFKFIERNTAVTAHRGSNVDDGLIQVTWSFEVIRPVGFVKPTEPLPPPTWWNNTTAGGWGVSGSLTNGPILMPGHSSATARGVESWSTDTYSLQKSAPGVTAPGSVSHQQFRPVGWFETEATSHVMIIKLAGEAAATGAVQNVVYTRSKVGCTMCGHKSRPTSRFCSQCGASLNVIG